MLITQCVTHDCWQKNKSNNNRKNNSHVVWFSQDQIRSRTKLKSLKKNTKLKYISNNFCILKDSRNRFKYKLYLDITYKINMFIFTKIVKQMFFHTFFAMCIFTAIRPVITPTRLKTLQCLTHLLIKHLSPQLKSWSVPQVFPIQY